MNNINNDSTVLISKRGMEILRELKKVRDDFQEVSKCEAEVSEAAYSELENFFLEEMRPLEAELAEEIIDANNFRTEYVKTDTQRERISDTVHQS